MRIKNIFWPIDLAVRARRLELVFWGIVLAFAYFPLNTGWFAWIALARPLVLIAPLGPRGALRSGFLFTFTACTVSLYWIGFVTPPGVLATIAILSLYAGLIFALVAAIHRRHNSLAYVLFPVLWVGLEYFRALGELSFPWTDLSYTQGYYLYFIQMASLTGAHGVSFVIVSVNVLIAFGLRPKMYAERRMTYFLAAAALVAAPFAYGWIEIPAYTEPPEVRIGLLQGNFSLAEKWNAENRDEVFRVYDSLAGVAGEKGAQLIVWPETSAPVYMLYDRRYVLEQTKLARASGAPNLIGTMHTDFHQGRRRYYNAAVQLSADGEFSEPYLKRKLVPFAEQAPYQDLFPFLRRDFLEKYLTFIKTYDVQWWSDFRPGDSIVVLEFDSLKYVPLICFEVAYPEYVREALHRGAEFILTITNDTWFKKSPGPYQHERIAIMRAVENRAWLARAANSGFTFIADPYGRVQNRLPWYTRGVLVGELDKHYHKSPYYYHGPVLAKLCFIFTLVAGLFFSILGLSARLGLHLEPRSKLS